MSFIRRLVQMLVGNPNSGGNSGDVGIYHYIKLKRTGRVVKVRVNRNNDLTQEDEGSGFFATKVVAFSYDRAEVTFHYDSNKRLVNSEIEGGTLVDEDAYEEDQAAHAAS